MAIRTKRKREILLAFYVTPDEKAEIVNAARINDQSVSDYCRKTLIRNCRKTEEKED